MNTATFALLFVGVAAALTALITKRGRLKSKATFAIVGREEAKVEPYPYVYVNEDSSARELHQGERKYLETNFFPSDGARPYIKQQFSSRDGWGSVAGFTKRSNLPPDLIVQPPPNEDPSRPMGKEEFAEFLRSKGLEVTQNADGNISFRKPVK